MVIVYLETTTDPMTNSRSLSAAGLPSVSAEGPSSRETSDQNCKSLIEILASSTTDKKTKNFYKALGNYAQSAILLEERIIVKLLMIIKIREFKKEKAQWGRAGRLLCHCILIRFSTGSQGKNLQ